MENMRKNLILLGSICGIIYGLINGFYGAIYLIKAFNGTSSIRNLLIILNTLNILLGLILLTAGFRLFVTRNSISNSGIKFVFVACGLIIAKYIIVESMDNVILATSSIILMIVFTILIVGSLIAVLILDNMKKDKNKIIEKNES